MFLSAEVVGAYTDKDLLPRGWLGLGDRPNRRGRLQLTIELVILVVAVAVTQWATATVVVDEDQAAVVRVVALTALLTAAAWTVYAIRVLTRH